MSEKNTSVGQPGRLEARKRAHWVAKAGLLAAGAILLMYLELVLPFMPTFLKFDFSEVVVLLAAFSMGPLTAVLIELVKNLAHLPTTGTGGVGELANFVIGSAFVGTAGLIYRNMKSRRGAFIAMGSGTLVMTLFACVINYFIMIPFYVEVVGFPLPALIEATQKVGNTLVTSLETLILFVFVPFNLFKGLIVSLIVAIIYKRVSPILHR
ncbi:MAG: ECF transporter S component [Clostridiales bacterium]|nr:ECF transporter S component [Clostridiales bacterium]